jgi:hypothetical protein
MLWTGWSTITTNNSYLTITNVSVVGGGDKNTDQYTGTL